MSALRSARLDVRLNERLTVTGASPWLTLGDQEEGADEEARDAAERARKTWPWPAVGAAAQRNCGQRHARFDHGALLC
jgi:hypothetical protein